MSFMSGGGGAPDPDPRIAEAALKNAELGEDWLNFSRERFAVGQERQEGVDEVTQRVAGEQLETQDQANRWATEDRSRWENTFRPVEDEFIQESREWGSEANQDQAAADARADVQQSAASQRRQTDREMASMGISPDSGRYEGTRRSQDTDTALASAGAQNQARTQREREGVQMKGNVANMGQNYTARAANELGLGVNAGNAATGNVVTGENVWRGNSQTMGQGFSGAMQGSSNQGNILGNLYGNELSAWQTENSNNAANTGAFMGAAGNIIGSGIESGWFSSKDKKKNKKPADGALEAVTETPVESWEYKDSAVGEQPDKATKPATKGRHVGPYAEDFAENTGMGNGKKIEAQDAIGVTMKAVQELNEKVERLARHGMRDSDMAAGGLA